jgi:hypothetical protein
MSKSSIRIPHDIGHMQAKPKRPRTVAICVAIFLLGPIALEGALCSYAQWCEVTGRPTEVSTPIIDTIVKGLRDVREWHGDHLAPSLHRFVREPKLALPFSSLVIVVAIAILRR